jgi:HlyD family secretion protein
MIDCRDRVGTEEIEQAEVAVEVTITVEGAGGQAGTEAGGHVMMGDRLVIEADARVVNQGRVARKVAQVVEVVGRPAFGQEKSTVGIFKLAEGSNDAIRTQVQLGRSSVNTIEIINGLQPGDRVILSDMSQWDSNDRIRLN